MGSMPEIPRNRKSGIVSATDDTAKETTECRVGFDAASSFRERRGNFRAQGAVVGEKIHPGLPQYREQFRFQA
jgi:hypothetical protein